MSEIGRIELQNLLVEAINQESCEGVLVVDEKGRVISHNFQFDQIWQIPDDILRRIESGVVDDSIVLSRALDCVADPVAYLDRVKELYADPKQIDHCEIELLDGRIIDRHSTALHNGDGTYVGRIWFFRDITASKQAQENLLLTQFANDHAPDSIFWLDEQARIVYVNEAASRERGYTKEELLGMSVPDLDPDFSDEAWPGHWRELKQ